MVTKHERLYFFGLYFLKGGEPVRMRRCQCWSWPSAVVLGRCPAPAGCSCGAPPPPHRDADAQPATSSSFPKVSKREEKQIFDRIYTTTAPTVL